MAGILQGRNALVTGASSGIGEAAALGLAEAGANVAVSARRADRLEALCRKIEACGVKALPLVGDVADEAFATDSVTKTIEAFGRIDIVINSAGIIQAGGMETSDIAEYRRVYDVNVMGTVYTCKAALAPMKAQQFGDIINISSMAARKAGPAFSAYMSSKHAVNALTDGMRQELGSFNVRASILMPGATATEVANNISDAKTRNAMQTHVGKEGAVMPKDIADAIVLMCAMPRRTNISEIHIRPTTDCVY